MPQPATITSFLKNHYSPAITCLSLLILVAGLTALALQVYLRCNTYMSTDILVLIALVTSGMGIAGLLLSTAIHLLPCVLKRLGRKREDNLSYLPCYVKQEEAESNKSDGQHQTEATQNTRGTKGMTGDSSPPKGADQRENVPLLAADHKEMLLRSMRGIPYLIQAIHYSMETASTKGRGGSVIHTAPGCISLLDERCCNSACTNSLHAREQKCELGSSSSFPNSFPRMARHDSPGVGSSLARSKLAKRSSGPEEEWRPVYSRTAASARSSLVGEPLSYHRQQQRQQQHVPMGQRTGFTWTNQQLRLAMMDRRASLCPPQLSVFPYSELSLPLINQELYSTESGAGESPILGASACGGSNGSGGVKRKLTSRGSLATLRTTTPLQQQHRGSGPLPIVTTTTFATTTVSSSSRRSSPMQRRIRCIGMSEAFLLRFNNSFKA